MGTTGLLFLLLFSVKLPVDEIIQRSVQANERDWKAGPTFEHQERDVEKKDGQVTDRTYQVVTMDGTPYKRLIAIDGHPLSAARERQEMQKEKQELARRRSETPEERRARIDKWQKNRQQENLLMTQMVTALTFHLAGEEDINGRPAYVLTAEPNPNYRPINREAKVLTGMRGKLWIDKQDFHWAKVEAEVIHPVTFGGFLARVDPGTRFLLEKEPVGDDIWQAKRFEMHVAASILFWGRNSAETDTYRDYQKGELSGLQTRPSALEVELETQKLEQIAQCDDGQQPVAVDHQQAGEAGAAHLCQRRDGVGVR